MKYYLVVFEDYVDKSNTRSASIDKESAILELDKLANQHVNVNGSRNADYHGSVSEITVKEDVNIQVAIINAINDNNEFVINSVNCYEINNCGGK